MQDGFVALLILFFVFFKKQKKTSIRNLLRLTSGHTYILEFNKELMWESRKSVTNATSLQILICIVRGWKRTGMIIIAHTQNNMFQCSGACFHNGAISSDQCSRTNSNDDDSYCRCFGPSVYIASKDLHRLNLYK